MLLLSACVEEKGKISLKYSDQNTYTPPVFSVVLSNTPANPSSNYYPLNVNVGGNLVVQYSYAIIADNQICALAAYSSFFGTSVPITGVVSEGGKKLCVKGKSSDGVVQANAVEHSWYQDNTAPGLSLFELRDNSDGSATGTDSFTVNAVGASAGTPTPLSYCFKTSGTAPSVGDGCWSTSATQSVAIAGSTTTIYAWVKDAVQNISASSSDTISVLYPTVALTNAPSNPSSSTPMNVTVGGTYVGSYDYVLTNQGTSCSVAVFPGTWSSILTPITSVPSDGLARLCVKGRTPGGIEATSTYVHDWLQDSTGPTVLSFTLRDQSDNSSTGSDSYTVSGIFSATGAPMPLEYCATTIAGTPTPTDGCWGVSTSTSVVIGFATTTVYGWARDAYKNLSNAATDTIAITYPVIETTNLPSAISTSSALNIDVFGSYVHLYDYSLTNQSTDCLVASYTSTWISATTTNITATATDGLNRVCIKARTIGGVLSTSTYVYDWTQASAAPAITLFELRDQSDGSNAITDSATVDAVFNATGTPGPLSYCVRTASSTPLPGDGCWNASSTQPATIVSSATFIYGWVRNAYGVMASSSDSIPYSSLCDSGSLATTCVVTSTKTLMVGELIQGTGNLVVSTGGSINATGTTPIGISMGGDITLQNGGSINGNITATSTNIYINASSTISANALGSLGGAATMSGQGSGAGTGTSNVSNGGGGAGHGNVGGAGQGGIAGGASYGSTSTPTSVGSGGGGAATAGASGGNGGGAIKLNASGIIAVTGTITANGGNGLTAGTNGAGGGSGGSIWIIAAGGISGTGTIAATGGNGGISTTSGGSGSGGRVAIESAAPFYGTVNVSAGTTGIMSSGGVGISGSFYSNYASICFSGDFTSTCIIDKPAVFGANFAATGTGDLIIASGGALKTAKSQDRIGIMTSANITLQAGGAIYSNLNYLSAVNITVASGAAINVDGKGELGANETKIGSGLGGGAGTNNSGLAGAGAGHGGAGGLGHGSVAGGQSYGSTTTPTSLGSGGGGSYTTGGTGGNGGGAVKILSSGVLNIAGSITANGNIGLVGNLRGAGGGAGGSVWIVASGGISGTGTISANGGNGGNGTSGYGGGGGGGRIAIEAPRPFYGTVSVDPGTVVGVSTSAGKGLYGSFYTSYTSICNTGDFATTCTIDKASVYGANYSATGTGNLIITATGSIKSAAPKDRMSFSTAGNITIQSGGGIYSNLNHFEGNNINIESGAFINVNGKGESASLAQQNGNGLGAGLGTANTSNGGGGAGFGGAGGTGTGPISGGGSYGSTSTPMELGSSGGGAAYVGSTGGAGGGAVKLIANGILSVSGTISANGSDGGVDSNRGGGGGSGGSIWIIASGGIAGLGTVSAVGGVGLTSAYTPNPGGGGAGGRIAIQAATPFYGTVALNGGAVGWTTTSGRGSYGSFYTNYASFCNSGTFAGTCTINKPNVYGGGFSATGTGDLVITSTGLVKTAVAQDRLTIFTSGNVTIQTGGAINSNLNNLTANNISIESGASINVNGKGEYAGVALQNGSGSGAGAGTPNSSNGGGGAGHGGLGGTGQGSVSGGSSYGSMTSPTALGSSGGGAYYVGSTGGAGGGAVKLTATGMLTVSGTITANGSDGLVDSVRGGGGGAGGSIWIIAAAIANSTGTITANGGNGSATTYSGGGGAGGRIALTMPSPFYGQVTVSGGARGATNVTTDGGVGTIYVSYTSICTTGTEATTCNITKNVKLHDGYNISATGNFIIDSGGSITTFNSTDAFILTTTGNVTLQNGGSIGSNVTLNANNLNVNTGSSINANGKGYGGGSPGNATYGGYGPGGGAGVAHTAGAAGAGGGYGGIGGTGQGLTVGGSTYGSVLAPQELGSGGGGGGWYGAVGGAGGGKIKITTTGNLAVTGTISANGDNGSTASTRSGGGGSGGSVWIVVNGQFYGTGLITAHGGNGIDTTYDGGGGGGGRMALEYYQRNYIGSHTVNRGTTGAGALAGVAGSLCLNKAGPSCNTFLKDSLRAWFAADQGITKNGSDVITAWKDQSGYDNNVSSINGGPVWYGKQSAINNLPVIRFNGTTDYFGYPYDVGTNAHSAYVVAKRSGGAVGHQTLLRTGVGAIVARSPGSANWGHYFGSDLTSNYNIDGQFALLGSHVKSYNDVEISTDLNREFKYTGSSWDTGQGTFIGGMSSFSQFFSGDVAEVLVFSKMLTIAERQEVEGYLRAKYGFNPVESNNRFGWFKADLGSYTDAGCTTTSTVTNDDVYCWKDNSGRGNNLSASSIPKYKTGGINKRPTVYYDGTRQHYCDSGAASGTAQNMFVAFQRSYASNPAVSESLMTQYKDSGNFIGNGVSSAGEYHSLKVGIGMNSSYITSSGSKAATTSPSLLETAITDRSVHRLIANGKQLTYEAAEAGLTYASGTFSIGYAFEGDISEMIFTQKELSEYQRSSIDGYLASKYGVPYTYPAPFNTSSVVGWWMADGGISTNDKAAQFTMANTEYLSSASNAALQSGDIDFSVAAWVYFDSLPGATNQSIISKYDSGTNNVEYMLRYTPTNFCFGTSWNGTAIGLANVCYASVTPQVGQWYYIVAWHDATANTINISVNNGAASSASDNTGVFAGTGDLTIGSIAGGGYPVNGRIAKTGYWKKVLTAAERTALYNKGRGMNYNALSSGLKTSLISYWNLDEASGTRNDSHSTNHLTDNNTVTQNDFLVGSKISAWADQSGRSNHATSATSTNQPAWISDGGTSFNNKPVIRFDGANDYLNTPNAFAIGTNHTVFMVAKSNGAYSGFYHNLLTHIAGYTGGSNYYQLYADSGIGLFYGNGLNVSGSDINSSRIITTTKSNTTSSSQMFVNGTSVGTGSGTASQGSYPLFFGSWNSNSFNGDMAEVLIFSDTLSTAQREAVECYLSAKYNIAINGSIVCP